MTSRHQKVAAIAAGGMCVLALAGCGRGKGELRPDGANPVTLPSTIPTTTLVVVNESTTTVVLGLPDLEAVGTELNDIGLSLDAADAAITEYDSATPED